MSGANESGTRRLRDWLEVASFMAVIVGIIVGFADHFANQRKEQKDDKEALYDSLDAEYRDQVKFCAEHPRLNPLMRNAGTLAPELNEDERIQQYAMFALLIDLFERAFLGYHAESTLQLLDQEKQDEWEGWEFYVDSYLAIPVFRETWDRIETEFDDRFQVWMKARITAAREK